jgi:hypothetical protein
MGGYVQLTRIVGTLFKMILKVWAYSGLVLVFCFLLYYIYGGVFAVVLLFFSLTGNPATPGDLPLTESFQVCCTMSKTIFYSIPSYLVILVFTSPFLRPSVFRTKAYKLEAVTVS